MTIGTTSSSITVQGNGATTTFAYPFLIPAASDAEVVYTSTTGVATTLTPTQYTLTGIGSPTGGTVTYPLTGPPIASGSTLTVSRMLPLIQATSISAQGPTFAAIESALDYLTMELQQVNGQAERAIVINPADTVLPTPLPIASVRAGQYLYFDSNGNPTVAGSVVPSNVPVSGPMVPVLAAATTMAALELLGVSAAMFPVVNAASPQLALEALGSIVPLANVAALAAYNGSTSCLLFLEGYYAANDGGQGLFFPGSSTAADGGSVIHDANGNSWYRLFGGGPFSVRCWGAKGDGATNDYTAIQGAINYCVANFVGPVYFPEGNYIVNTGLTLTSNYVNLIGESTNGSLVQAGVNNINLLSLTNCVSVCIEKMWWNIPAIPEAVSCVVLNSCVECKITDCNISGGYIPLQFTSNCADNVVSRCKVINSYGPAQVFLETSSATFFDRVKADQVWPAGTPGNANLLGAWQANTPYTGYDVVSLGGYYIQCIGGGTSGPASPTLATYGTDFVDGTVTWQLACFTSLVAFQVDTGSNVNQFFQCDAAGALLGGYYFTNEGAGAGPQKNTILSSNADSFLQFGVRAIAGAGLLIDGMTIGPAVENDALGVNLTSAWAGDATIRGCLMTGAFANGIEVDAGTNTVISNNQIYGSSGYAIYIAANVNQFTITGNQVGQSGTWGTNAHGITVATGSSNFYVITGNNSAGALTGITDGGSGGDKYVGGNI